MNSPESPRLVSLKQQLLVPFLVLGSLFAGVILFGLQQAMQESTNKQLAQRGELVAHSIANIVGTLADHRQVSRLVSAMSAEADVRDIVVTAGARVYAASRLNLIDTPAVALPRKVWDLLHKLSRGTIKRCEIDAPAAQVVCAVRVILPAGEATRRGGFVYVVLDSTALQAEYIGAFRRQVVWVLGFLLPLFGVVLAIIQRQVIAPVTQLSHAAAAPDLSTALNSVNQIRVHEIRVLVDTLKRASSARRTSEAALERLLERFDLAVNGAAAVIWDIDLVRDELYFSPRLADLLGLPLAALPCNAADFNALIHPADLTRFKDCVTAHLRDRTPYATQFRLRCADGNYCWVSSRGQAIWGSSGRATRIAGSLTDITAQRLAAAELETLTARETRLIQNFAGVIFEFTHSSAGLSQVESYSARLHEFFELPGEATAFPLEILIAQVHRVDQEALTQSLAAAVATRGDWTHEFRVARADGQIRWLAGHSTPRATPEGGLIFTGTLLDISARKQAELNVTNREGLLASIVANTLGVPFRCRLDNDWSIVFIADGIEKFTGYPAAAFVGPAAHSFVTLINPDDFADFDRRVRLALASGESWQTQYRIRHRNGTERWIASHGALVVGLDGAATFADGVLFDIDALKKNEIALHESETRLNLVVRGGDLGTWEWDFPADLVRVNPKWSELHGVGDRRTVSITEIWNLIHPADTLIVERALAAHLTGAAQFFEAEYRVKDGQGGWVWVLDRGQVVQRDTTGKPLLAVGTNMDITERKRSAQRLQESETLLRTVLDMLPQRVFWKNRKGRYLGSNKAFAEDNGYTSVVGLSLHDLGYSLADIAAYELTDLETIESGTEVNEHVLHITMENEKSQWVSYSKAALRDAQGEIIGLVGTYLDVSVLKENEIALIAARNAADDANRAKGEFLSVMGHEIRTPLNGVLGCLELLSSSALSVDQQSLVATSQQSGQLLLSVLNDILDISKIESGNLQIEHMFFGPREICAEVLDLMVPRAVMRGLELTLRWDPLAPAILESDPTRFRQVLANLVGNALKFTAEGGVIVDVTRAATGGLHLAVHDTGIGLAANRQAAIFEKFSQADSSISRQFGGTGLGLSISQKLVQALGGELGVESTLGVGSTFWFTLPRGTEIEMEPEAAPLARFARWHALVLCDYPPRCAALTAELTLQGMTTEGVASLAAACAALKRHASSVVFFDYRWLAREGNSLVTQLRAADPNVRLIPLCTVAELLHLDSSQFHATLQQPVTRPGILLDAVLQALDTPEIAVGPVIEMPPVANLEGEALAC